MDLTVLEALEVTATEVKEYVDEQIVETKEYIDEQPVISYSENQFLDAASRMTAKNNVGVFVGSDEPGNALDGDIWIDTKEDLKTVIALKVKKNGVWVAYEDSTKLIIIEVNDDTGKASMTFYEIIDAMLNGNNVILMIPFEGHYAFLSPYGIDSDGFWFSVEGFAMGGFGNLIACIDTDGNIFTQETHLPTMENLEYEIDIHNTDNASHSDIRDMVLSKANAEHDHDDRYYTESEIDEMLTKHKTFRTSLIDLSKVPYGKLYEKVEGIDGQFSWSITRDENNRPIKIIDDIDGHECEVRWWD